MITPDYGHLGANSPALVLTPQEKGRAGGGGWPEGGNIATEDVASRLQVLAPEDKGHGHGHGHGHDLVLAATTFAEKRN